MKTTYPHRSTIKQWAEDDRPREKLYLKGASALSNAELMAILIGSGNRDESATDLSRRILADLKGSLRRLNRMTVNDLTAFKGIGQSKACSLVAALELGRRTQASQDEKVIIRSSRDVYRIMGPILTSQPREEFWVLYLNQAHWVIEKRKISEGGVSGTVVDPRIVFNPALHLLASSVVLVHNHPSGSLKPSKQDEILTQELKDGGKLLQINVIDHLIVSEKGYFSFADEGIL